MKRLLVGMVCALLFVSGPRAAVAQETKTVRGAVTAIAANSLTVKADGKEVTFVVDAKTQATAPGGTTKTRAAQAEGKPGIVITEVVKVGQGVEVKYHEQGMHAATVRVLASVPKDMPPPPPAPAAKAATGTVSAVSGSSLTVKGATGEWTFAIDEKTKVVGAGLSTATRKMESAGKKTTIVDVVGNGDTVRVSYLEMGDMKHASEVRVVKRGK
jgi:hypothetical protein